MKISAFTGDWYPWHPSVFRAKTLHLSAEQDGIYRRLIDHYMETRHPLIDNDSALARAAGIGLDSWTMAAAIIRPFFNKGKNGLLNHEFCDNVLKEQDERNKKQSEKGKIGARKRWKQDIDNKEENTTANASAIARAMPGDATGQDNTIQDITLAASAARQQGKKSEAKIFSHDECKSANRGDGAWMPEAIDGEVLPGGWDDEAKKYTKNDDRIMASWRKFKETSEFPYRLTRWKAWIANEK